MKLNYCKNCGKNVLFQRPNLNIGILITLAIFTGGVGIPIYIWIHHAKHKKKCIYCGSELFAPFNPSSPIDSSLIEISGKEIKYCFYCGRSIDDNDIAYCPDCGEKV